MLRIDMQHPSIQAVGTAVGGSSRNNKNAGDCCDGWQAGRPMPAQVVLWRRMATKHSSRSLADAAEGEPCGQVPFIAVEGAAQDLARDDLVWQVQQHRASGRLRLNRLHAAGVRCRVAGTVLQRKGECSIHM